MTFVFAELCLKMSRSGGKTNSKQQVNAYEQKRLMSIQANKNVLESFGIKRIASSFTSLVDSTKEKKRKGRSKATNEDDEYVPNDDHVEEARVALLKKAKTRGNFIPPMSLARHVKMNKKQVAVAGSKELLRLQKGSQDFNENESNGHEDAEIEKDYQEDIHFGDNLETSYDQVGQF
ncbi:uncharacterized protein [Euphorbia lathyris]|uniref:uncharacterized protein isoform X3 n=1 Tax=Euphorbia lathyris TaxID=212925 RepID=UPI00331311B1